MDLASIFRLDDVFVDLNAATKAKAVQLVCQKAAHALGIDPAMLADVIQKRENLGSTGIGRGIAVPHSAVSGTVGLRGFIFRMAKPLDFEAIDGALVDLIFLLVFEEKKRTEYLKVLASIARKIQSETLSATLRSADGAEALHAAFVSAEQDAAR